MSLLKSLFYTVAFTGALVACGPVVTHKSPLEELKAAPVNTPYRIGAGDTLAIKFFFSPELNETMQVRPDGKISLTFIPEIQAAGITPQELGKNIRTALRHRVKQADVAVIVREAASHKVFVGGEVAKPGTVALMGGETIMQVLNAAGWITPTARRKEIALVRTDAAGKQSTYAINLNKIIKGEDMAQNVVLQAGDVILVPPSDITAFDRWVDQHIRLATPIPVNATISNQYRGAP